VSTLALLLATLAVANDGSANDGSAVNFDRQVIPVLTKAGCNTGACHGAAVGRGGFRLSLYGGDPEFDYESIALELQGRRVNLSAPAASLFVLKPTESIDHGGGYRLESDGIGADILTRWVDQGALRVESEGLQDFQVTPASHVVQQLGDELQLRATASFDGQSVDVTPWTVFTPEDPVAVEIASDSAVATLRRRGRHVVVARYLDQVVAIELIVPLSDKKVDLSTEPRENFIDEGVLHTLETLRIPVSPFADDAAFVRRVTLDLTGRLPTPASTTAYCEDNAPDRKAQLVNRLLASDEFNEYWTMQFAKLLRIRSQPGDAMGAQVYHQWLRSQIARGTPYDELAGSVLLAMGDSHEVGPANFYRTVAGPREQAEFVSELFMGNRLRCANCHNHPFDRWTQDDYHGLAAVFAKLTRGRVIELSRRGEVTHPRTGEDAIPRIPGEEFLEPEADGRTAFADWLTDSSNPYFAKAIVNRLWKQMMGRGLVEPTDDLRATNPATHPKLLNALAEDFVKHDYDLRHTLRRIALSTTYARSSSGTPENNVDDRYYSHALKRSLAPEVLADAISDVTGLPDQYGEQPFGTRAVSLFDPKIPSSALDVLGRCSLEESCETGSESVGGMTTKLHLFNGALLNSRISRTTGRLGELLEGDSSSDEIVTEFYQRALGRVPSNRERKFWQTALAKAWNEQDEQETLEDILWSLLTCQEFGANH
jgi:hypothetical protein